MRIPDILGSLYEIGNLGQHGDLGSKHPCIYKYKVNLEEKVRKILQLSYLLTEIKVFPLVRDTNFGIGGPLPREAKVRSPFLCSSG